MLDIADLHRNLILTDLKTIFDEKKTVYAFYEQKHIKVAF